MSKKPVTMSVARPSRAVSREEPPAPIAAPIAAEPAPAAPSPVIIPVAAPAITPPVAPVIRPRVGSTARLEQGVKRIVVDVTPTVHKQVKVKAIDYPGGIKEYILRLLEADGLDLSSQPDFVPRPK